MLPLKKTITNRKNLIFSRREVVWNDLLRLCKKNIDLPKLLNIVLLDSMSVYLGVVRLRNIR